MSDVLMMHRLAGNSAGTSPISGQLIVVYQLPVIIAAVFQRCNTLFSGFRSNFSQRAKNAGQRSPTLESTGSTVPTGRETGNRKAHG